MEIAEAMYICIKNNIKVYPIIVGYKFKIEVSINGNIKLYDKILTSKEVNKAMTKTYIFYAKKFFNKELNT